jgi:hypothetical protein
MIIIHQHEDSPRVKTKTNLYYSTIILKILSKLLRVFLYRRVLQLLSKNDIMGNWSKAAR